MALSQAATQDSRSRFIGTWYPAQVCSFYRNTPATTLAISAANTDHIVVNELDYPILQLRVPMPVGSDFIVTRDFNYVLTDDDELSVQLKGPDGGLGACYYTRAKR